MQNQNMDETNCPAIRSSGTSALPLRPRLLDNGMPEVVSNPLWIPLQPGISFAHRICRVVTVLSDN